MGEASELAQEARKRWAVLPQQARLVLGLAGALAAVVLAIWFLGRLGFHFDPLNLTQKRAERAERRATNATATAAVATGQAAAAGDAQRIVERSTIRTETTRIIHEENADAIRKAPGAGAPLDPGLVATVNRGLCRYAADDDPACAAVRVPDPADIPR